MLSKAGEEEYRTLVEFCHHQLHVHRCADIASFLRERVGRLLLAGAEKTYYTRLGALLGSLGGDKQHGDRRKQPRGYLEGTREKREKTTHTLPPRSE